MFRSGPLTRARLGRILRWVEKMPDDLKAVAKVCMIYPSDLLAWYAAGQDPACTDPLCTELAWKVAEIRGEAKARNYARVVAAAERGVKRKTVAKPNPIDPEHPIIEETEEDVLPAAWAIDKLDAMAERSPWEISPNAQQAEELIGLMRELTPTPLLTDGSNQPIPAIPAAAGDEQSEPDQES